MKLKTLIKEKKSYLCVGLDPKEAKKIQKEMESYLNRVYA